MLLAFNCSAFATYIWETYPPHHPIWNGEYDYVDTSPIYEPDENIPNNDL
jgi:hypothetical protein